MSYTHADGAVTDFDKREPSLWGVYIRGQDEWLAAPSRYDAEQDAQYLNGNVCSMSKTRMSPVLWAVPDLWPWSDEDHAAELKKRAAEEHEAAQP